MPNNLHEMTEYIADPCGVSSLPLWKAREFRMPDDIEVIHERGFTPDMAKGRIHERFFRLKHDLRNVPEFSLPDVTLRVADMSDCGAIADVISRCYPGICMTGVQVEAMTRLPVHCPELWLIALNAAGEFIGCALADLDRTAGEGIIEWVQVLPQWRRRSVGTLLVCGLLRRMAGLADFATVSGSADNPTNPEALYRRCGFTGSDIWHVLRG